MKKPIYKRWWFIAICALLLIIIIGALQSGETLTERAEREIQKSKEQKEAKAEDKQNAEQNLEEEKEQESKIISPKDVEWNTEELYTDKNGNANKAAEILNKMTKKDFEAHEVKEVDISKVIKAPWKYYGEFISFEAYAAIIQAYPPNSEVSKILANGKEECTEIVLTNEEATTYVNYYFIGDATNVEEGQLVTVVGLPVGLVDVENMMGGITTSLVVIGK